MVACKAHLHLIVAVRHGPVVVLGVLVDLARYARPRRWRRHRRSSSPLHHCDVWRRFVGRLWPIRGECNGLLIVCGMRALALFVRVDVRRGANFCLRLCVFSAAPPTQSVQSLLLRLFCRALACPAALGLLCSGSGTGRLSLGRFLLTRLSRGRLRACRVCSDLTTCAGSAV